jgi:hypothetical protein
MRILAKPISIWVGTTVLLLFLASTAFWVSLGIGITAAEMHEDPIHDAAWTTSHTRMTVLANRWTWAAEVLLVACIVCLVVVLMSYFEHPESRTTSAIATVGGAMAVALLIALGGGFELAGFLNLM